MPFLALLKLVTPKEYFYAAIALALAIALAWARHSGEVKIERKDAALRAAAAALNKAAENLADIKEIQIGQHFQYVIKNPIADAPGLVCHNSAPAVEPKTASGGPRTPDTSSQLRDGGFNPSGELLTLLRDDDAQIAGLIDTVLNLEAELTGATK